MKILVTGISGFVGRHFLEMMEKKKLRYEVIGIYNANKPGFSPKDFTYIKLKLIKLNLLNKKDVHQTIKNIYPTHILHLAAKSSVGDSWKYPSECILENTEIFLNILEAVRLQSLNTKIVSIGSAEEYGPLKMYKGKKEFTEELPSAPINPYGTARVVQRKLVDIYAESYGLNILHVRSFNHFGPYQSPKFVIPSFIKQIVEQIKEGKKNVELKTGNLDIVRDFTDVRDVVAAYWLLLKKGKTGQTYNVCSGKGISLRKIIVHLEKISGEKIKIETETKNLRPSDNPKIIGSNHKIFKDTGWKPGIGVEESLTDTFEYWKGRIN